MRVEKHRNQCHNQEAMGTSENKKKIIQGAIPNKFSTAEAAFQPVENNDYYKLELSGDWKPMCSKCPLSFGGRKSFQNFVPYGDKQTVEEMRRFQNDLHYDSMLAVPCLGRRGGLAMLWKAYVDSHI